MCGIGGILFSRDAANVLTGKINRLNAAQLHRGPDGNAVQQWPRHALCHQRLALLDQARGAQPLSDPAGRYFLVYNGELYNYPELKQQLQPHYTFITQTDTEVVLAAWLHWGAGCLNRFNGMFAFFIWDNLLQTGFGARDITGVKPLVYTWQSSCFVFASEVKAILQVLDTQPAIEETALAELVVAPSLSGAGRQSLFAGVYYLQPGEYILVNEQGCTTHSYAAFNWQHSDYTAAQLTAEITHAMDTSVQLSLRADVPVGVFFSGGLDSSLIAAIAARHATQKPGAFTIAFENHEGIYFDPATIVNTDDWPHAKWLAGELGLPFHTVLSPQTNLQHTVQQLAIINDRVPVWEQELAQHFLSKAAAVPYKAVLVGDAADETHYGYFFLLNKAVNYAPLGLINRFGGEKRTTLLSPKLQNKLQPLQMLDAQYRSVAAADGYYFGKSKEENILAMSSLVNKRWLGRLLHNGDIHTMHFGLEARVPFANRNVLDVAAKVPPQLGFADGVEKNILRRGALHFLPERIALRKKSSLPRDPRTGYLYQQWLPALMEENSDFTGTYLHQPALENLCRQTTLTENDRMMLFNIICLLHWSKQYAQQ